MKQKLGFGLMLTALSFAFLFGLVPVLEQAGTSIPVDELFRDWSESSSTCNYICYMETPYADSRGFAEQQEALETAGAIPALEGYENFQASTAYNQDGSIYEIDLLWYTQDLGVHESMEVTIIPQEPEDKTRWDGLYTVDKEQATATQIGAVTVYGDKYEDGLYPSWVLVFTLPGGTYCQIHVVGEEAYQDMGKVLEFLLDQGVDWDAFALEKGDLYETIPFAEADEFLQYAPDISGLPLYEMQAIAMTRNGVPISAELQYSYEEAQNSVIFWSIETDPSDWQTEAALGNLEEQTEEAVQTALEADRAVGFYDGDIYLYVSLGNEVPVELAMELFRELKDLPETTAMDGLPDLYRDNSGQSGDFLGVCGNGLEAYPTRDFSEQIGNLIDQGTYPRLRGLETPTITAEYDQEEQLLRLSFSWKAQTGKVSVSTLRLEVFPQGLFREFGYYDVDLDCCTKTEWNGITIYGDGNQDSSGQALLLTLQDGTVCQIIGGNRMEEGYLTEVLDFLLLGKLDLSAFTLERGDKLEMVTAEELPTYFSMGMPELSDLTCQELYLREKNGLADTAVLWLCRGDSAVATWTILLPDTAMKESDWESCLGDLGDLTEADLQEQLGRNGDTAGFFVNGLYVRIAAMRSGVAEDLWPLIASLR